MIKAIFWDNDGVLVDTEGLYFESNRQVLARHGIEFDLETFIDLSLKRGAGFDYLLPNLTEPDIEKIRKVRNQLYTEMIRKKHRELLLPGVKETLGQLYGKLTMGIVTSCRKDHFSEIHRSTGILEYFDFILQNGDYERSKPNPDPYLKALEISGFNPGECLVVEDSERGLQAAAAAEIPCVIISHSLNSKADFSLAVEVLENITGFPGFLERYN